jgi:hypothetical protein
VPSIIPKHVSIITISTPSKRVREIIREELGLEVVLEIHKTLALYVKVFIILSTCGIVY